MTMDYIFDVAHFSVERLLQGWRWLCPESFVLLARNAFGDLFLQKESGQVFKLDVSIGQLTEIAESEEQFRRLAGAEEKRQEWFAENDAATAAQKGLAPNSLQCIGFKTPLMFAESGSVPDNAYLADLYELVSFLGYLNQQTSGLADGAKVRLEVKE
jgi:hypothetical protein